MNSLAGKTALVTGASRGIGRAIAVALAEAGARVLVHYSKAEPEADTVVAAIRGNGGRAEKVAADLSLAEGPHQLAEQVRGLVGSRLDILVANAGVSLLSSIEATKVEDFDRLFAVNVRAPYFLVQQLLPVFGEGSSIIFISLLVARSSFTNLSAYSATKGASARGHCQCRCVLGLGRSEVDHGGHGARRWRNETVENEVARRPFAHYD